MVKWLCKAAYGPLVKGRKKYERGDNPSYDPLFAVGNILRDIYDDKVIVLAVSEYIVTTTGTFQYLVAMCDDEGKYDEKTSYSIEEDELYPLWLEEMGEEDERNIESDFEDDDDDDDDDDSDATEA